MGERIQVPQVQDSGFGERLAALRKAAGFTQTELAAELGVSQRMVACHEQPSAMPAAHLLPAIAQALEASLDDLHRRTWPSKRATAGCAAAC